VSFPALITLKSYIDGKGPKKGSGAALYFLRNLKVVPIGWCICPWQAIPA
jgi:hypothetical protein